MLREMGIYTYFLDLKKSIAHKSFQVNYFFVAAFQTSWKH